jgi:vacuolar-type H+-ATPase subunit H
MFGKVKKWGARKLLERQLKDAPKEQQEMIMTMFEKNPELLEKIAKEIEAETKAGASQMQAAMKVMPKYQAELQGLMGNQMPARGMGGGAKGFNPNGSIRK